MSRRRAGSALCHLSLGSLWHGIGSDFILGSWWEPLPFHSEAKSSPVTARTPFFFTHAHSSVSGIPACSCPCSLPDSQWPAQSYELSWPQRMNCATCKTGRPSSKGTSFPSWLSAVTRTSWDNEKNKSQRVFQVHSEQGRVLEDATSRSRS